MTEDKKFALWMAISMAEALSWVVTDKVLIASDTWYTLENCWRHQSCLWNHAVQTPITTHHSISQSAESSEKPKRLDRFQNRKNKIGTNYYRSRKKICAKNHFCFFQLDWLCPSNIGSENLKIYLNLLQRIDFSSTNTNHFSFVCVFTNNNKSCERIELLRFSVLSLADIVITWRKCTHTYSEWCNHRHRVVGHWHSVTRL